MAGGMYQITTTSPKGPRRPKVLFVVAPQEKKNRLLEQLRRPTFKEFKLVRKVSYLSYEAVEEIDNFFSDSSSGLSVDLIKAKAEVLQMI